MPNEAAVTLKLEDGTAYPLGGKLEFSEVSVDLTTGAVALRARFPNPRGLLLPGMYVRAVVSQAIRQNAFLLPAAALTHDPKGAASVLLVGRDGKVVKKTVQDQGLHDNKWVVIGGINAGDRVIVQGSGKAKPGQQVRAVAASSNPAVIDASPGGSAGKGGKAGSGGASGAAQ